MKLVKESISRQEKWSKANLALGLCRKCNAKRVNATFCAFHAQKARDYRNAYPNRSTIVFSAIHKRLGAEIEPVLEVAPSKPLAKLREDKRVYRKDRCHETSPWRETRNLPDNQAEHMLRSVLQCAA